MFVRTAYFVPRGRIYRSLFSIKSKIVAQPSQAFAARLDSKGLRDLIGVEIVPRPERSPTVEHAPTVQPTQIERRNVMPYQQIVLIQCFDQCFKNTPVISGG